MKKEWIAWLPWGKWHSTELRVSTGGDGQKGPPSQVTYNPGAQDGPKSVTKAQRQVYSFTFQDKTSIFLS